MSAESQSRLNLCFLVSLLMNMVSSSPFISSQEGAGFESVLLFLTITLAVIAAERLRVDEAVSVVLHAEDLRVVEGVSFALRVGGFRADERVEMRVDDERIDEGVSVPLRPDERVSVALRVAGALRAFVLRTGAWLRDPTKRCLHRNRFRSPSVLTSSW